MNNSEEKLNQLLRTWQSPVVDNPGLGAEVWRRIAVREDSSWSREGTKSAWLGRPWFGPALAATLVLGAVLAGVGAAELRIQSVNQFSAVPSQEQAYFESINPVALARHTGHQ